MHEPVPSRPPYAAGYTAGPDDPFEPGTWAEIAAQLERARNYWVSTTRAGGRAHATPVWGLWLEGAVWFSTSPDSVKARNLQHEPRCVIHLESGDDAVILEGACERVEALAPDVASTVQQFVTDYKAKYDIEVDVSDPQFGLYRLAPRTALTWREQNFPNSNARWNFAKPS